MQFARTDRGKLFILAICIAIALLGGITLCRSILDTMLRADAQATCSGWVSMMVERNPDVLRFLSGASPSVETRHFLDESSHVGDIYRFRIWTAAGHLAYTSERMASAGTSLDSKMVAEAQASGSIVNEAHVGRLPYDLPFYVQSFIPIRQNESVVGVVEVYLVRVTTRFFTKDLLSLQSSSLLFWLCWRAAFPHGPPIARCSD